MLSRRLWLPLTLLALVALPGVAYAGGDGNFQTYQNRGMVWMYLASFGFGFLTSLTPCVYPMIPITLSIFGARGKDVSKGRAVALATMYIVGMGATYSVLGVLSAIVGGGADFGTQLASPVVVIPLVILFLALAASMFGAFELNLPSGLQAKLNQIGGKGFGGAFAMGLVGGLIAAPCTGPFLAGLLTYVSTTGSVVGGGSLLFVYALGMGVLFWVLAAFALSLPKSGPWMESVKSVGGVALLLAALYFLRPLIRPLRTFAQPDLWFLAVAIVLAVAGLAIGAIHLTFYGPRAHKVRKAIGVVLLTAGAFAAYSWKLAPASHLPWLDDEEAAFAQAKAEGKGVFVDFSATWCTPCQELEVTFGDVDVHTAIVESFVPLKFDVTEDNDANEALKKRFDAVNLPAVRFLDANRVPIGQLNEAVGPTQVLEVVRAAAAQLRAPRAATADAK